MQKPYRPFVGRSFNRQSLSLSKISLPNFSKIDFSKLHLLKIAPWMEPFIKKLQLVLVKIRPFGPLILTAVGCFIIGFSIKRIIPVAVINGDSVSRSEYNDLLLKRAGRSTMQEVLINHL